MTVLRAGSASDVGQVRSVNQDSVFTSATVFAVADGMGGHAGGEVASSTAVEALNHALNTLGTKDGLVAALETANDAIARAAVQDPSLAGMGTTMVAASLMSGATGDQLVVANIGDSRAYLFRRGVLSQISLDHSVAGELLYKGSITEEEAGRHPQRHVITRALGIGDEINVDLFDVELTTGDRVLLCSDGLSDEVSNEEIARALSVNSDPTAIANDLVLRANANGGVDNISVVVIEALIAGDPDDESTQAHAVVPPLASEAVMSPSPVVDPALNSQRDEETPHEGWLARRKRLGVPRLLTFRVFIFVVLVAGLIYSGWYFLRWYATSSYFVTSQGTQIVVYQGRPGGVLWFKPKQVEVSTTTTAQILPIRLPALENAVTEPSLSAAKNYIKNLAAEYQTSNPAAPTTTTTQASSLGLFAWNLRAEL